MHLGTIIAQNSPQGGLVLLWCLGLLLAIGFAVVCVKRNKELAAHNRSNDLVATQLMQSAELLRRVTPPGHKTPTEFNVAFAGGPEQASEYRLWAEIHVTDRESRATLCYALNSGVGEPGWLEEIAEKLRKNGWVAELELRYDQPVSYSWLYLVPHGGEVPYLVQA